MRHAILFLLTALAIRADALSDLRGLLRQFDGATPVSGSIDFTFSDSSGDEKKPVTREGRATAAVSLSSEGLRVVWAPDQLAAAVREAEAATDDPHAAAPTREAMSRLNAASIHDYLDAGAALLRDLSAAKLLGETQESRNGQPARVLTFKLEPPLSDEDKKVIKEIDGTASVWLAADGTPLAAESSLRLKGRVMVMIGFEHTEKEQYTFARVGNHLVVTTHQRETKDDGGGQHARGKSAAILRLNAGQ